MDTKPIIAYDDFAKLDLRVGTIEGVARVEGSEKLLKLEVVFGDDHRRQIIAGIGTVYGPDDLVGRQIVTIVNLEPKKLMGLVSEGMVLAADSEKGPIVLSPIEAVSAGATIK
ncbi:MAG: methionine--tRNA ligase subunit beta [Patescibacteria group bacterium]